MKKIILIIVTLLFSMSITAQEKLEYKLSKGDIFKVQQNAVQVITQQIQDMSHELTNNISGKYKMKVVDIIDNNYIIELSFTDLNMKMTSSLQGVLMDVKAKDTTDTSPQTKMLNALLNIPIQITLAKNGDITKVTGGEKIVDKMVAASGITDETILATLKETIGKEYGTEGLANSFEQMTFLYPTTAVKVNDTWENEYAGKLATKNKWTLNAITSTETVLSCEANVVMIIEDANTNMNLTGTQNTTVTTDSKTGFIKKMEVSGMSEGHSTMTMLGEQQIPTKITTSITYKTIE